MTRATKKAVAKANRSERVVFRCTAAEKRAMRTAAAQAERPLSDWLRLAAIRALPGGR